MELLTERKPQFTEVFGDVSLLDIFPSETIQRMLDYVRVDDWFLFGKTCSRAQAIVGHYVRGKIKTQHLPDFNKSPKKAKNLKGLYTEQIKGLMTLREFPMKNLFLQSPMGTGKTLLAIMHAVESWKRDGTRTIIIATTKCFTSWLEHFNLCGLNVVKSNPSKSDALVLHSTCKNHRNLVLETEREAFKSLPYYIILTTPAYISRSKRVFLEKMRDLSGVYTQIIADEAHLLKGQHYVDFLRGFDRRIYLSATPFCGKINIRTRRGGICTSEHMYDMHVNLECHVDHPVKMTYELIAEPATSLTQITSLLNRSDFKGKKVVLFTDWNNSRMGILVKALAEKSPQFRFVRFYNTSLGSLDKFRNPDEKCVLVTTILSATKGTNFEVADSAIYVDFGSLVIERARQCFGRVRRRNNPNPEVKNYIFYDSSSALSYTRTKINIHHALDLSLHVERKKNTQITLILKVLANLGIDIYTLPKPELITIFCNNTSEKSFLPFKEEEYTLPLFQVMQLMNVGA